MMHTLFKAIITSILRKINVNDSLAAVEMKLKQSHVHAVFYDGVTSQ